MLYHSYFLKCSSTVSHQDLFGKVNVDHQKLQFDDFFSYHKIGVISGSRIELLEAWQSWLITLDNVTKVGCFKQNQWLIENNLLVGEIEH